MRGKEEGAHELGVRAGHAGARAGKEAGGLYALLLQDCCWSAGVGDHVCSGILGEGRGEDQARAEAGHHRRIGIEGCCSPVCQGQDPGCGSKGEEAGV